MNQDNSVCEYDLFSSIKNSNDGVFISAVHSDFKDIMTKINQKQAMFNKQNHPYEEWNNLKQNFFISDIDKYLKEKEKIKDIKKNFLTIFSSKNAINGAGPI
jgi:hypothetical protein